MLLSCASMSAPKSTLSLWDILRSLSCCVDGELGSCAWTGAITCPWDLFTQPTLNVVAS